jgi:hypothetical protein
MKRLTFLFPVWIVIFTLVVFLFAIIPAAFAQEEDDDDKDLEGMLENLSRDAGSMYIAPIVSAFGSDLNGGWFHKAASQKTFSLDLEFGLVAMGTFYQDTDKNFSAVGQFRFNRDQAREIIGDVSLEPAYEIYRDLIEDALIEEIIGMDIAVGISGATIIGSSEDNIEIEFRGEDITISNPLYGLPGEEETITLSIEPEAIILPVAGFGDFLEEISFLPFAAPQISVGTVLGTRAVFRYIPKITIPGTDSNEDMGEFSWFGYGLQHNPAAWLPAPLPIDISAGFFKQTIKLGSLFQVKTTAFGFHASKRLGTRFFNVTPYAGYMFESSSMEFKYDFQVDVPGQTESQEQRIELEFEGENRSRIILGLSLRLLLFNINADYNIGRYNSVTVGFMLAI